MKRYRQILHECYACGQRHTIICSVTRRVRQCRAQLFLRVYNIVAVHGDAVVLRREDDLYLGILRLTRHGEGHIQQGLVALALRRVCILARREGIDAVLIGQHRFTGAVNEYRQLRRSRDEAHAHKGNARCRFRFRSWRRLNSRLGFRRRFNDGRFRYFRLLRCGGFLHRGDIRLLHRLFALFLHWLLRDQLLPVLSLGPRRGNKADEHRRAQQH